MVKLTYRPNVGFARWVCLRIGDRGENDTGKFKRFPLPECEQPVPIFIGSKGYCTDQNRTIHWQENYYLPSALADGYRFAASRLTGYI